MLQKCYKLSTCVLSFCGKQLFVYALPLLFLSVASIRAQNARATTTNEKPVAKKSSTENNNEKKSSDDSKTTSNAPAKKNDLSRWIEFDTISFSDRYHFIENTNRSKSANNDQYQIQIKGRFKFDPKGKYAVTAGLYTGNSFTSGWNNTGWGTGRRQTNLYVKQLYFQARPVKGLEFQLGGIPILFGQSTEATAYDNDNYITGERVSLKYPKKLFFDEISVTNAFLGDLNQPSVFRRFKRLGRSNYRQFLVARHIGKRANFSVDCTFQSGTDTLRQAIRIKVPESKLFDSVVYENYQIVGDRPGYGFNAFGEKKLNTAFSLSGGFAHIDRKLLNGDRFAQGNRIHFTLGAKLGHDFSMSVPFTQMLGSSQDVRVRTRVDVVLTYNLLGFLQRKKVL